ncbi:MAG: T9SS type A sorting domain-containing protein, partial [Flavobacteriales bacterium]
VYLPRGARLDIFTPDHAEHLGPISQRGEAIGSFGTAHFRGHSLIIEYFEPYASRGEGRIQLAYVSEGYRSLDATSLGCYASLYDHDAGRELEALSESVVMILVDHGQRIATGTLVNHTNNNAVPYVLTAAQALVGSPEEMVFAFHYVDVSCMYPYVDGCSQWVVSGASLLHAGSNSRLSLLQLDHLPESMVTPFFAGWHVTDESTVSHHWSIQHALGLAQSCKEYFGQMQLVASPDGVHRSFTGLHEGASAAGSIGSPLFDAEHDLIGVYVGGNSDCQGQGHDYYTLLKDVWSELDDFLSPSSMEEDRMNGMYYSNEMVNHSLGGIIGIYPNPARDILNISMDQSDELISIEIFDMQGRSLAFIPTKNSSIDISALPSGTFTLRVVTKKGVAVEPLVVRN